MLGQEWIQRRQLRRTRQEQSDWWVASLSLGYGISQGYCPRFKTHQYHRRPSGDVHLTKSKGRPHPPRGRPTHSTIESTDRRFGQIRPAVKCGDHRNRPTNAHVDPPVVHSKQRDHDHFIRPPRDHGVISGEELKPQGVAHVFNKRISRPRFDPNRSKIVVDAFLFCSGNLFHTR